MAPLNYLDAGSGSMLLQIILGGAAVHGNQSGDVLQERTIVLVDLDERRACEIPDWYGDQIAAFERGDLER